MSYLVLIWPYLFLDFGKETPMPEKPVRLETKERKINWTMSLGINFVKAKTPTGQMRWSLLNF